MKNKLLLIFFKKIDFAKIINLTKNISSYIISSILHKPLRWGMPLSISVEPTTSCNLRCPECPVGRNELERNRGTMDLDLYKSIINQTYKYLLNLFLYFQGEPFLSENIFKMIKYASERNIFTSTSTNGHFIDEEIAENAVISGLDKLIISMDGTTQDVYKKYRINGNIEIVKQAISRIIRAKEQHKSKTPIIEIQFLVLKTNEHQIEEMKAFCKNLSIDKLSFKSAQIYDYQNDNKFIPSIKKYSRYKKNNNKWQLKNRLKNRCFRLWNSVVITWDGEVLPCCFDKDAKYSFGNIQNSSLKELITNRKFKTFAQRLQTNRKSIDICQNCTE